MSPHELVFFYDLGRPECYLAAERITRMRLKAVRGFLGSGEGAVP